MCIRDSQVPIVWRDVDYNYLKSRLTRNMTPEDYYSFRDHIYSDFSYMHVNDIGCMDFAGGYPGNLHEEINNFSVIAGDVYKRQVPMTLRKMQALIMKNTLLEI